MQNANMRMVQRRNRAGLAFEALPGIGTVRKMGGKNLYGYNAFQAGVARPIHLSHAAGAERRLDFIRTEPGA
jgi:hypothetical protein